MTRPASMLGFFFLAALAGLALSQEVQWTAKPVSGSTLTINNLHVGSVTASVVSGDTLTVSLSFTGAASELAALRSSVSFVPDTVNKGYLLTIPALAAALEASAAVRASPLAWNCLLALGVLALALRSPRQSLLLLLGVVAVLGSLGLVNAALQAAAAPVDTNVQVPDAVLTADGGFSILVKSGSRTTATWTCSQVAGCVIQAVDPSSTPVPAPPPVQPIAEQFQIYKAIYGKSYTAAEAQIRADAFAVSLSFVSNFQVEGFQVAVNGFSDMTEEEFKDTYLTGIKLTNQTEERRRRAEQGITELVHEVGKRGTPPASVDWRDEGAVVPIVNQGSCGSCWAFAAVAAMEGAWAIANNPLTPLSERFLADCIQGSLGCGGGWPASGYAYAIRNGGCDTEASYPYTAQTNTCHRKANSVGAKFTSQVTVAANEAALMDAVALGPVAVAIDASQLAFRYYKSGIHYDAKCASRPNHAVTVVGYGSLGAGQDYWIVRNSWGRAWGDNGYILMARNRQNNCLIASNTAYPVAVPGPARAPSPPGAPRPSPPPSVPSSPSTQATTNPTFTGVSYLGCFNDNVNFGKIIKASSASTPNKCISLCREYAFAGLVKGGQCWCSDTFPATRTIADGQCLTSCTSDPTQVCGGDTALSVYRTERLWQYFGCRAESSTRVLPNKVSSSGATPASCVLSCSAAGYLWAGVEAGGECWCGSTFPSTAASTACTTRCSANKDVMCGGSWALSLYMAGATETYTGCFVGGPDRAVTTFTGLTTTTPDSCIVACRSYVYASVEAGGHCFCGNVAPTEIAVCDAPCKSDMNQVCGGSAAASVYRSVTALERTYVGCVPVSDSLLTLQAPGKTPSACVANCQGSVYAGMKGSQCYCGNELASASGGTCDIPCSGDSNARCGGSDAVSVWHSDPQSLGCFSDSLEVKATATDQASCRSQCRWFQYAGILAGTCWCGNTQPSKPAACSDTTISVWHS